MIHNRAETSSLQKGLFLPVILLIAILTSSCGQAVPLPTATPSASPEPTLTPTITPSPTPAPTFTPTPYLTLTPLPSKAGEPVTLTIVTTADLHVTFNYYDPMVFSPVARIGGFISGVREEVGEENMLLLDGGDVNALALVEEEAFAVDQLLLAMGYDGIAIGNHEWDWGRKTFFKRVQTAGPLFLAANLTKRDPGAECTWEPFFDGYRILEKGPADNRVRVAVIGITGKALSDPEICWQKPAETLVHLYQTTEVQDADAIIIVTHAIMQAPLTGGEAILKEMQAAGIPIALILGGHGHQNQNQLVGDTLLLEPGSDSRSAGVVTLTVDKDNHTASVKLEGVYPIEEGAPVDMRLVEMMETNVRPILIH